MIFSLNLGIFSCDRETIDNYKLPVHSRCLVPVPLRQSANPRATPTIFAVHPVKLKLGESGMRLLLKHRFCLLVRQGTGDHRSGMSPRHMNPQPSFGRKVHPVAANTSDLALDLDVIQ